jgi:hypothetical protein
VVGNVKGVPTIVAARIYDSNIGTLIEVPARVLDRVLARDIKSYSIMTVAKFGKISP